MMWGKFGCIVGRCDRNDVHTSQYYNQDRNEKDGPAAECE